ncbi:hypothetical protein M513_12511 [Trichuris suis]|uniref:Retrotransposon gag domain-containing protein n=1 Tax=Trichuris suis TaxID=68888 RepID=A0A085LNR6_9BILA|nr:hypothetical protein M513_12511 [Trichuris suis]
MAKRADDHPGSLSVPAAINVSLPRQFGNGDFIEWASRFELCSRSNGWNDTVMAIWLCTLLEGDACTIYQSLPEDVLSSYQALKQAMVARIHPEDLAHSALQRFEERYLRAGETVESFAYHLRRLLALAMPRLLRSCSYTISFVAYRFAQQRTSTVQRHYNALLERLVFQLE